jgi:hypothetical protein
MESRSDSEAELKKQKEQGQLMSYMMYVMVGFFAFFIIFGFIYSDLSLVSFITYIGIVIIFFFIIHYAFVSYLRYIIHISEHRNRWQEQRYEVEIVMKALFGAIAVVFLMLFSRLLLRFFSAPEILVLLLLLFLVWLIVSVKKYEKRLYFWESKSYRDIEYKETLKNIERALIKNDVRFKKIENLGTKFFTFNRYDYIFELDGAVQFKIFFPFKTKSKMNPVLSCFVQLGPLDNSKKVALTKYKVLLDGVLE